MYPTGPRSRFYYGSLGTALAMIEGKKIQPQPNPELSTPLIVPFCIVVNAAWTFGNRSSQTVVVVAGGWQLDAAGAIVLVAGVDPSSRETTTG
mmetsp:Transcript_11181/g.30864  ORF Transcript_11181/g.30864 Transcript_11181/m.30864 type:complete len:93 (+) Transcript_11181:961-1239(+)